MAMNPIPGGFFPASPYNPQNVPQFQPYQPMNAQPGILPAPMPNLPMDFNPAGSFNPAPAQFGPPSGFSQQPMPFPNQFGPQPPMFPQQQAGPYPFGPGQTNPLLNQQNGLQPAYGNPVPPNAYMSNSGQAGPAAGVMPAPQGPYGNTGWVG